MSIQSSQSARSSRQAEPGFVYALSWFSILGCGVFAVTILIADFVVPGHDWIADTISDLAAGRYEFIVDTGIYAFAAALIAVALVSAHLHLGGTRWSVGTVGLAAMGLIVFLIGARDEYGDLDDEGVEIHIYLVYAIAVLMAMIPWCMAKAAGRINALYRGILIGISGVWIVTAPIFFFLPTDIDGLYERCLGLLAILMVITLTRLFARCGTQEANTPDRPAAPDIRMQ